MADGSQGDWPGGRGARVRCRDGRPAFHGLAARNQSANQVKPRPARTECSDHPPAATGTRRLGRQQEQQQQSDKNAPDELLRPLLKTLLDAHDALSLAEREVQRLRQNSPVPPPAEITPPPAVEIRLPFWARWLGLGTTLEQQIAPLRTWRSEQPPPPGLAEYVERFRQVLDALLVGYRMSLQRIERAFEQQGLEPIPCTGQPFDPETMEVAEVVHEEGRSSTEVLSEVRRGYRWHGRLFRYAQVRVAKPRIQ